SVTFSSAGASGTGDLCPGWEGWVAWNDFAPDGTFCVPATRDALPEPIEWVPCDPILEMPTGCRQMKITWPARGPEMGGAVSGWVDEGGKVFFQFVRNALAGPNPWRMLVVAEADGPVHSAFLDASGIHPTWTLTPATESAGVRQGKTVFTLQRWDLQEGFPEAVVGAHVGELSPKVLHVWERSNGHAVGVSSGLWATRDPGELRFGTWSGPLGPPITSADAGGGQQVRLFPFGDFAVWNRSSYPASELWAYKAGKGVYPLVAFGGDPFMNVDGFGTDGQHMVWVESQVASPFQDTPFEAGPRDLMVSPYSETREGLAPRRISAFPSKYALISPFVVGCGYAAHGTGTDGQVLLFRLSDGHSWRLPSAGCTPPDLSDDLCSLAPVAVTCDEVFVQTAGKIRTLTRFAIDALGPPAPPR
ncbi:MAG: hypothetical protein KDD47_10505, partial [Acidobacteria bacterium]|nr:hypothetical protein [Acidobacteriota bacterium]